MLCMQQEFSVDIDFRQTWTDKRLRYNSSQADMPRYIRNHDIDKYWLPDVYFPNEKNPAANSNKDRSVIVYPNGTIRYVSRWK